MNLVYLMIGGNIGNKLQYLSEARKLIEENCGKIIKESSIYETAAWGIEDQASFLNQALAIETCLGPVDLLNSILKIEEKMGRTRPVKYGPRIIDIDIVLFNNEIINLEALEIPHPQMHNRRFVLVPLNEIAGKEVHPVLGKTITQLLKENTDTLTVNKIN